MEMMFVVLLCLGIVRLYQKKYRRLEKEYERYKEERTYVCFKGVNMPVDAAQKLVNDIMVALKEERIMLDKLRSEAKPQPPEMTE